MLITTALVAAIIAAILGAVILWSNPARRVSWAAASCSFHIAAWLSCLHVAIESPPDRGLIWLRSACAVGGLIPFSFWIVKESIVTDLAGRGFSWICLQWRWLLITTALVALPFTHYFVPAHSTHSSKVFGQGYYVYMWSLLALYAYMFADAFRRSRQLGGARRLELQIWLGGGCAMVSSVIITMALNAVTGNRIYIRMQPLLVLLFYSGIAYAITARRIFDARQILLVGIEKFILVAVIAGFAYLLDGFFALLLPEPFAFFATTAIALSVAVVLSTWLDRIFQFYPQATTARQATFAAARERSRVEDLHRAFIGVLKGWGQSEHAVLLCGAKGPFSGGGVVLSDTEAEVRVMRQLKWATPEQLGRERPSAERTQLARFLNERGLAVLVLAEGPSLGALVGVGYSASRRPYTYPQVTQLMELASIMESALERAHFSSKVQHTEQLATVGLLGASLAHEIRNPLVTIKTFVQLLPTHHQDPLFREKFFRLIGDEVNRIDQLTEQLLDLATPRTYEAQLIELHPVLRGSLDLLSAKAAQRNVQFFTEFSAKPDLAFTDSSAAKQVMLNLCFNAIQAAESSAGCERWVKVATRNSPNGIEMAVADSGPGIPAEVRPRLFQPFQTTKSTGFGLGLAICSDILTNLNASISVDAPVAGQGATFRVTFPCQPLSS